MGRERTTDTPKCVIAPQLWQIWLANKREGDIPAIMELAKEAGFPASKPVVTQSILYGFCTNTGLRDLITKYFADRYQEEARQAEMLEGLTKRFGKKEIKPVSKSKTEPSKPVKKAVAKKKVAPKKR